MAVRFETLTFLKVDLAFFTFIRDLFPVGVSDVASGCSQSDASLALPIFHGRNLQIIEDLSKCTVDCIFSKTIETLE